MSRLIRRYLMRELWGYWLAITVVLWLVLVAARFSLYLGQAASGLLPADAVLTLLALKSVGFLVFLMPLALFLALLWLLGRLNRDYESLVLSASGLGPLQLYRALMGPVLVVTLLVAVLSGYLVPHTARYGYQLRAAAEQTLDVNVLVPGRFHELRKGRWLVFAERAGSQPGVLENVFVHIRHAQQPQVLVAERASVRQSGSGGDRHLVLENGYRYDGQPGRLDYRVLRYREYGLRLGPQSAKPEKKWDAVLTGDLWRESDPRSQAELQMRLSRPLTVLVLALTAVPLGRFRSGASRFRPVWMGVFVFIVYFNLLATGQLWLEQEAVPGWLGLWWVHALMLILLGAYLGLMRRLRWKRTSA